MQERRRNHDVELLMVDLQNWERKITQPTLLKNVGAVIAKPINWVFDKIPNSIHNVIGKSIEGLFNMLILTSNYTFSNRSVFDKVIKNGGSDIQTIDDLNRQPIKCLSKTAYSYCTQNEVIATLEGAGCGLGGIALIAVDIPILFGICFRVIQQIGTTLGYDLESPIEKQFIMKLIDFSSSAVTSAKIETMFQKEALLQYIKTVTFREMEAVAAVKAGEIAFEDAARLLLKQQGKRATQKAINEVATKLASEAAKNGAKASAIVAARQSAKSVSQNLTKRKLAQLIPVVGALIGAGFNYWFVSRVAESAYYFYLKRHVDDNYQSA